MRTLAVSLVGLLLLARAQPAHAYSGGWGYPNRPPTFRDDIKRASLILHAAAVRRSATDAKEAVEIFPGSGDVVFRAIEILKADAATREAAVALMRGRGDCPADSTKWILFCDLHKGEIVRYRTIPAAGTLDYFRGVLALPAGDGPKQLAHYLRHLEHASPAVAEDAYLELSRASSRHLRAAARGFPADRVARWLREPKVPLYRHVTYALLLAHCGDASHGKQVREMLDAARKQRSPNLDQFLIAYVLVQPGEGWEYLDGILSDPRQDLPTRQAALQAVRFFWYERDDLLPRADLVNALLPLLYQGDMVDYTIDTLRRWKRWEVTGRVLTLARKRSYDVPVIRRAVLLFALSSPLPEAVAFVAEQRRRDPDMVRNAEELLRVDLMHGNVRTLGDLLHPPELGRLGPFASGTK
jgi:hypothetical protein